MLYLEKQSSYNDITKINFQSYNSDQFIVEVGKYSSINRVMRVLELIKINFSDNERVFKLPMDEEELN